MYLIFNIISMYIYIFIYYAIADKERMPSLLTSSLDSISKIRVIFSQLYGYSFVFERWRLKIYIFFKIFFFYRDYRGSLDSFCCSCCIFHVLPRYMFTCAAADLWPMVNYYCVELSLLLCHRPIDAEEVEVVAALAANAMELMAEQSVHVRHPWRHCSQRRMKHHRHRLLH